MKISQLRGLLGQLQLRHGDIEVMGDIGGIIRSAAYLKVNGATPVIFISAMDIRVGSAGSSEPAAHHTKSSDDR